MRYVYGDVFWLLNFVLNYILLYLAALMSGSRTTPGRLAAGAALGASYALLLLYPTGRSLLWAPAVALFSLVMLVVALRPSTVLGLVRQAGWLYGLAFVCGGASMAMGLGHWYPGSTVVLPGYILVAGLAAAGGAAAGLRSWTQTRRREADVVTADLSFHDQVVSLTALVDTGNHLRDPFTGWPVVVAEWGVLAHVLPEELGRVVDDPLTAASFLDADSFRGSRWAGRVRVIPFSSLGRTDGLLWAVRPDWVCVHERGQHRFTDRVVVALSPRPLAPDAAYRALLPREVAGASG